MCAVPRACHLGGTVRSVRGIDIGKLESPHGGQNGFLFVLAIFACIREELFRIQWAERAQNVERLIGDEYATERLQNRHRAEHARAQESHVRLLGVVDNLKTEEHGGRETVHRAPGHVAGHIGWSTVEHFGPGVGRQRDECFRGFDGDFKTRRIFGRFTVRETRIRPVHGKANVQERGANDDTLHGYASFGLDRRGKETDDGVVVHD